MKINLNGKPIDVSKSKTDELDPKAEEIKLNPHATKRKRTEKNKKDIKEPVKKITETLNLEKTSEKQEKEAKKHNKIINEKMVKILVLALPILCILFLLIAFKQPISEYIYKVQTNTYIDRDYVMMPDVTGLSESEAISILENKNINTKITYMYNQYFDIGTVIKCSVDPDNPVKYDSVVTVYVCKDDSVQEVPSGVGYFDDVVLPDTPATKETITLINAEIDDIYLILTFQNNSKYPVSGIKYTLGFSDSSGEQFVSNPYIIDNINLASGDTVTDKIELTNPKIAKITYEYAQSNKIKE